jgi:hypothetical protein
VDADGLPDSGKYDASVSPGMADPKNAELLFQQALCAFFHVTVTHERRETPVLVLRAPAGRSANIAEHAEGREAWELNKLCLLSRIYG